MSLVIDGVLYADGLNSAELSHLRATVNRWEQNPDIPRVVLIGSDPSRYAIPGSPAFAIFGIDYHRNRVELLSTKHLLENFKLPPELHETAARVNVYPARVPRDELFRYIADDKCDDGIVPFVASRMAALFGVLPPCSKIWVAGLGVVARYAVRRHLGMNLDPWRDFPKYFGHMKPELVLTGHPRHAKKSCVTEFGKWLNGGLLDANQVYLGRLQVERELRAVEEAQLRAAQRALLAAQQKKPTVRVRDTVTIRYLDDGRTRTVTLVRDEDHNPATDMIGVSHPLGEALEGARSGEEKEYTLGKLCVAFVIDELVKAIETALV